MIRPLTELDLGRITAIDERLSGTYKPDVWERRVIYYHVDVDWNAEAVESAQEYLHGQGATVLRTLVGPSDSDLAGFLRAVGFQNAPLQALEMPVA